LGVRVANGKIHRGFYAAINVIFDEIHKEVLRQGAEKKAVWITGHSLGGAMAIAFAYRVESEKDWDPAGIITFGQPLVFSEVLAQSLLDAFDVRYIRIVNSWDPVTRLVPTFRHAGARIHLSGSGYSIRNPMISYGTPADAERPKLRFVENDKKLEPMTEAQFQAFQNQLRAEDNSRRTVEGRAVYGGSIPMLSAHYMATYVERLKSIGRQHLE
jgi:hypothetical protein